MPSLREYFLTEADDYLARMDTIAASEPGDAEALLRSARALRGAAQMAREDRVHRVASALEAAAREMTRGARSWDTDTRRRIRDTVSDLRTMATAGEADAGASATAEHALARWREVGVGPDDAAPTAATTAGPSDDELRRYVASEGREVIAELERSIPALSRSPMGRDPLKSILRKQRALLGSAGLAGYPVVAGALRTIEDATRVIARQNLAVEGDWLALYHQAHRVLVEGVGAVEGGGRGDASSPAFVELRALRDRLIGSKADETPFQPPAQPPGGEPIEMIGFFRTEANKLIDRVERMAGAFAAATEERRGQLRSDMRDALNALRDTSRTFGFEEPARASEQALSRLAEAASTTLLGTVERLREIIHTATEDPTGARKPGAAAAPAATAPPAPTPTPSPALTGPAFPAAGVPAPAPVPATGPAVPAALAPVAGAVIEVPIEGLLYRGDSALRRALELRADIERAVSREDRAARESLEELFDLVRLAMS